MSFTLSAFSLLQGSKKSAVLTNINSIAIVKM